MCLELLYLDDYGIDDFDPTCIENLKKEALDFFYTTRHLWYMTPDSYDLEQHGHDFALTRNGHGAGYWDRGLGKVGDKLSKAADSYGDCDLYAHDGKVYAGGYEVAHNG